MHVICCHFSGSFLVVGKYLTDTHTCASCDISLFLFTVILELSPVRKAGVRSKKSIKSWVVTNYASLA